MSTTKYILRLAKDLDKLMTVKLETGLAKETTSEIIGKIVGEIRHQLKEVAE